MSHRVMLVQVKSFILTFEVGERARIVRCMSKKNWLERYENLPRAVSIFILNRGVEKSMH